MGEATKRPLRVHFDRRLKLEFRGGTITSDAGALAFRELDEALGLTRMAAESLAESRPGKNIQRTLLGLFRQAVLGRLTGYEDVNDAERLRFDLAIRRMEAICGGCAPRIVRLCKQGAKCQARLALQGVQEQTRDHLRNF